MTTDTTLRGILAVSDRARSIRGLERLSGVFPMRALAELEPWKPILIGPHRLPWTHRAGVVASSDLGTTVFTGRLDEPHHMPLSERINSLERVAEQHGLPELDRFAGDWAFASWNPCGRVLTLAVDPQGVQPLFYSMQHGIFLWSTHVDDVVAFAEREVDADYLAGALIVARPAGRSALKTVRFVKGGHYLRLGMNLELHERRYWYLMPRKERCANSGEAAEELRRLLEIAVANRLTHVSKACFELSGGFDSSTLTSLGRRRARADGRAVPVSLTYLSIESPEYDERRFVDAVRKAYPGPHFNIYMERFPEARITSAHTPRGVAHFARAAHRLLRLVGVELIVSGRGGDAVMGAWGDPQLWLLQKYGAGGVRQCLHDLEQWATWGRTTIWRILAQTYSQWSAHRSGQALLERFHVKARNHASLGAFLQDEYLLTAHAAAAIETQAIRPLPDYIGSLEPAWWPLAANMYERASTGDGHPQDWQDTIPYTYPYRDSRLLSFIVSLPARMVHGPYAPRALMRQALQGTVPDTVLNRRGKGYAAPAVVRMWKPRAAWLLSEVDRLKVVEYDLVDAGRLKRYCERFVQGAVKRGGNLMQIADVESWLRNFEQIGTRPGLALAPLTNAERV